MLNRSVLVAAVLLLALQAAAIDASDRYRSPRNPERSIRKSTELIVLHTTEAPAKSSLNKLSDRGEAHFCVTEEGSVYRIVDRDRVAFHAGRSMWKGKEDVDKISIGIECVGHHDKAMGTVQLNALRNLVKELQAMYHIPDDCVVCHSHVAYGAPNRWHRFKHRGRKRCGMLFAMPSVRRLLNLRTRPARDEDVKAGRLRNADEYLRKVLYGKVDTMVAAYARGPKPPTPQETGIFAWLKPAGLGERAGGASQGGRARESRALREGSAPKPAPKSAPKDASSTRSARDSRARAPDSASAPKSVAQLKAGGWRLAGVISPAQTAAKLAGDRWNAPTTYYTIRDKVFPGNKVDPAHFEKGMSVWVKK